MRFTRSIGLMLALLVCIPFAWGQEGEEPAVSEDIEVVSDPKGDVIVVCPIEGDIEPGVLVLVERAVEEARELNAKAIIFKINTFGGRVDSAFEIAHVIREASCRTIAYIEGKGAISAGALISFACNDIIMTEGVTIGAATPVYATSEGMAPAGEKSVSAMRAEMRALSKANGHNSDIAQAMVDKDIVLRGFVNESGEYEVYEVDSDGNDEADTKSPDEDEAENAEEDAEDSNEPDIGTVVYDDGSELVLAKGKLLTLDPDEAIKYGVIDRTVESLDDAVTHFMLGGGTYHIVEPNWAEVAFRFLTSPTIAGLLLMLGMGGLYLEVRTPGFGLPGIVGITCLCLFFGSHFVLGMAETIDILLVVAGVVLILIEIFIIPGFGIAGVSGTVFLLLGIYLSLVNFTIPQYSWDFARLNEVAYSFAVFVVSLTAFIALTWKLMPMMPFYGAMVLADTMSADAGYIAQDMDEARAIIGRSGRSVSPLRPTGKGSFDGKKYNVVTRGDFIEKDSAIRIVETQGNRYVVVAVDEKEQV